MIRSIRKPLWFLFSDERWLRGAIAFLDKYARDVITARRKDKDLATREDLLSLFMNKVNPDTNAPYVCDFHANALHILLHQQSDDELRDVIMNFLIAGRDTTAGALTWMFHELHKNPNVEAQYE